MLTARDHRYALAAGNAVAFARSTLVGQFFDTLTDVVHEYRC